MAEKHEPQGQPDNAVSPVPNRRDRRGGKSGTPASHGGKSALPRWSIPAASSRQYSTRRRGG